MPCASSDNVLGVVALLMKSNHNCHDLAQAKLSAPLLGLQPTLQKLRLPLGLKALAEVID
jgi:alpha-beta hydrolase superfamily lysophospholipase